MIDARAHFGGYADAYRACRPDYPEDLYDLVAAAAPRRERVWDCGSGSGQAAGGLARRFRLVVASDISVAQLAAAAPADAVVRVAGAAEAVPLVDGSVAAVTVAQALHWFSFEPFFAEVARVCVPGGLFAAWTYGLLRIGPGIDPLLDRLYHDILGGYWLPRRHHVDEAYAGIPVPFPALDTHVLDMVKRWRFPDLLGYLGTWSAGRAYRDANDGRDPVEELRVELEAAWTAHAGAPGASAAVVWPVTLRRFRVA